MESHPNELNSRATCFQPTVAATWCRKLLEYKSAKTMWETRHRQIHAGKWHVVGRGFIAQKHYIFYILLSHISLHN